MGCTGAKPAASRGAQDVVGVVDGPAKAAGGRRTAGAKAQRGALPVKTPSSEVQVAISQPDVAGSKVARQGSSARRKSRSWQDSVLGCVRATEPGMANDGKMTADGGTPSTTCDPTSNPATPETSDDAQSYSPSDNEEKQQQRDFMSKLSSNISLVLSEALSGFSPGASAFDAGKVLEAHRKLSDSDEEVAVDEGEGQKDRQDLRRRTLRIYKRFKDSLNELEPEDTDEWIIDAESKAGIRLLGEELRLRFVIEFPDCDPLLTFVALCEHDLSQGYMPEIERVEALSEERPADAVWRVIKKSKWTSKVEDNIRWISAVDALDEPEAMLWVSYYAGDIPDDKALPAPVPGSTRSWGSRTTFGIQRRNEGGCCMTCSIITRPSAASCSALAMSPCWLVKRTARGELANFRDRLHKHLLECKELRDRLTTSCRASLYQEVLDHLEAKV
eukprot:TRINITY_DN3279_c0_g1_i1.p1 TRINITY_DN3279_c0_g1~~TRINITY_DN3279_c0_g1_i1.p1  ORF type:complete len:445 (+),score=82.67 TRINITY_DN3279_c0_g1_i1:54-1388(+)